MRLRAVADLVTSSEVRVRLNAERLLELNPMVTLQVGEAGHMAHSLHPPWYFVDKAVVALGTPRSRTHNFDWVAERTSVGADLKRAPATPLALPCYRVPGGAICLDGNHRMIAAVRLRGSLPVCALVIHGPLDPSLLPDLSYWSLNDEA